MTNIAEEIAALEELKTSELRANWQEIYGAKTPRGISRDLLIRAAAYQIQEMEHGGLGKGVKRKLHSLMKTFDTEGEVPSSPATSLKPGSKLIREWGGKTHSVIVLDNGFDFEGKRYRSLSRIAREITGARWSGPRFFGLRQGSRP
jgi:hypothetical protein